MVNLGSRRDLPQHGINVIFCGRDGRGLCLTSLCVWRFNSGIPIGPASQLLALEQDHFSNASPRKVISHRAADDAAANNGDLGAGRKRVFLHSDAGKGCQ